MKKILLVLATAATFVAMPALAQAAPAADPQTMAAVKAMLDAMEARKMTMAAYAEMEKAMPAMMQAQFTSMIDSDAGLNAQQKKDMHARMERALPAMIDGMWAIMRDPAVLDEMMDQMALMYANNFTTAEINELAAFYRTPVGRKMIATVPKISADSMAMSQRVIMPRLNQLMQTFVQDLQK